MVARAQAPETDEADAALLRAALDAMTSSIAVLDEHGTIILVNAAWRRYGAENGLTTPDAGIGASYVAVCEKAAADGEPTARLARDAIIDMAAGRIRTAMFEYPCHYPGKRSWSIFRGSRFQVGGSIFIVVAHDDITERHQAEDELRASHRALESFNLAVSHDLRAPLRRIEEMCRIAEEDARGERGRGDAAAPLLAPIQNEASRARALADDLLDLSRVGGAPVLRAALDVTQLARDAIASLRASQPERRVRVTIQPSMRALADGRLVPIILANLIGNAWKFTKDTPDASIEVVPVTASGQAAFMVRDNGIGFSAREAGRLFEPFVRLDAARAYQGSGVGLAIVRRAVERHGGTIEATGAPGAGAAFRFTLGVGSELE